MQYNIVDAKYISDYHVWLKFQDGLEGEVDFSQELDGPIFEPLKDKNFFKRFDLQGHTLHWENDADFAPEYLYKIVKERFAAIARLG